MISGSVARRYAKALMMIGLDGSISDLNEAVVKIIGLARDELNGSDFTRYPGITPLEPASLVIPPTP